MRTEKENVFIARWSIVRISRGFAGRVLHGSLVSGSPGFERLLLLITIPQITCHHQKWVAESMLRMSLPPAIFQPISITIRKVYPTTIFFLPLSHFNEMMKDVVSPSRMATHTNMWPEIYTFADTYVGHFPPILYCFLSTVFLSTSVCLKKCLTP